MSEKKKYCSNCKKEVGASNFTVHAVHCARHLTLCQVCQEPVPRAQYQQHIQGQHGTLDCSKCGLEVEAVKIFAHEHEECPRRLVSCQFCQLEVLASELAKHTDYCGSRTERCKGCTKYVQQRHLQFHYNSDHKYLTPEDKENRNGNESDDESNDECPICLGPITLPIALECGHVFCMVCVKGIANTTKNCAICRRDIARDMLMDIRFCREEDVIKNYVNKPREKKSFRSHSVPGRVQSSSSASRRVTTQDYDDMVSHLLSNRTSSASVRYQRPANTHTPAPYTPYSYANSNNTTNTLSNSSNDDDDCCCSSQRNTTTTTSSAPSVTSQVTSNIQSSTITTSSSSNPQVTVSTRSVCSVSQEDSSNVSPTSKTKPRRPTSLALSSSLNADEHSSRGRREPPADATQEQYDRWLAFQLAQTEDDISAAEFNKRHRLITGRSQSMPEREIAAATNRPLPPSSDTSDSSSDEDEDNEETPKSYTSKRPPASPRIATSTSAASSQSSYSSTSSLSASSRSPSLSKSSSDSITGGNPNGANSGSNSNGGSRTISTGTRPKSSGLKKRVSFKEEAPEERRVAPAMLPCEFCNEIFSERDLMRHQTSCDLNETQMPRARRESITSPLLGSPSRSSGSPSTPVRNFSSASSSPNSNLASPSSPPSRRKTPSNLPTSGKKGDGIKSDSLRTPPTSPPPRPPQAPSSNRIRSSPLHSGDHTDSSSSDSRPTSVSPCPPHSNNSSSSGISSMASSIRSISSTPSSSSSASPIPAIVDTPTDIEADFEDDDTTFVKPRRGKLLSSAIGSWRNISVPRNDKQKYTRSMTCPLDQSGDDSPEPNPVVNSHSTSQLPPIPPRPESTPAEPNNLSNGEANSRGDDQTSSSQTKSKAQHIFIKRHKKYRAPAPPVNQSTQNTHSSQTKNKQEGGSVFKLDSKPMMRTDNNINQTSMTPCQYCRMHVSDDELQDHQMTCSSSPSDDSHKQSFRGSSLQPSGPRYHRDSSSPPSDFSASHDTDDEPFPSHLRRYDRAQSVLDERCCAPRSSRIERAHSIKETSRRSSIHSSMGRRWASRETLFGQRGESPSSFSSNSNFSGTPTSSISGQDSKFPGRGWADHVSMVHEDVKARLTSAKALVYDREKGAQNKEGNKSTFIGDLRSWLEKTEQLNTSDRPSMGSGRYRSSSMARPSLYSSSGFGSTTRLSSLDYGSSSRPSFNLSDSFGSAFRRRYVR